MQTVIRLVLLIDSVAVCGYIKKSEKKSFQLLLTALT